MRYDDILVFVTVAKTGGFGTAAEELHRTQPAVSKTIQRLEARFGVSLFDRSQYRPVLTVEGKRLYHEAMHVLAQIEGLDALAEHLQTGAELTLSIAIDQCWHFKKNMPLLKRIQEQFHKTQLQFCDETMGGPVERLLSGEAAIAIGETLSDNPQIESVLIENVPLVAYANPEFKKAHHDIMADETHQHELMQIILRDTSRTRPPFNFGVIARAHSWTVTQLIDKCHLIEAGFGWGRLPAWMAEEGLQKGALEVLSAEHFNTRTLPLSKMRLKQSDHGPVAKAVWEALDNSAL